MNLDDALFNWMQMKYVAEQRPDDRAAQETYQFFAEILEEDFNINNVNVTLDGDHYLLSFVLDGEKVEKRLPAEEVQQLWHDIEREPKYNQP